MNRASKEGEEDMPQIIITTDGPGEGQATEVHRERIHAADVETETASNLLVERIGWALSDADQIERDPEDRRQAA
jgi:hypothetical protein